MTARLKRAVSHVAYGALAASGATRVLRHVNRDKVPILMYHGLHDGDVDPVVNFDGLYLHVARFERQMRYLARHYTVVPLERLRDGAGSRRAVITFDDGYGSIFRHAYPVLKKLGLPATVFVATDFVEHRRIMWWDRLRVAVSAARGAAITVEDAGGRESFAIDSPVAKVAALQHLHVRLRTLGDVERAKILDQLDGGALRGPAHMHEALTIGEMRTMAPHGISFQSHGVTHLTFSALPDDVIASELRESKATLERWVGSPVRWFAYPFGDRDVRVRSLLAAYGYEGAVSCRETLCGAGDDPFAIPRIAVGDPMVLPQFTAAVTGARALKDRLRGGVHEVHVA